MRWRGEGEYTKEPKKRSGQPTPNTLRRTIFKTSRAPLHTPHTPQWVWELVTQLVANSQLTCLLYYTMSVWSDSQGVWSSLPPLSSPHCGVSGTHPLQTPHCGNPDVYISLPRKYSSLGLRWRCDLLCAALARACVVVVVLVCRCFVQLLSASILLLTLWRRILWAYVNSGSGFGGCDCRYLSDDVWSVNKKYWRKWVKVNVDQVALGLWVTSFVMCSFGCDGIPLWVSNVLVMQSFFDIQLWMRLCTTVGINRL